MSTATGTRIFGIRISTDPKIIIGVLVAFAGLLFWYNSASDDTPASPAVAAPSPNAAVASAPLTPARSAVSQRRAGAPVNDRGTLRLRPIDATRGDVDPTLRLDLLKRLSTLQPSSATRSLFEISAIEPTNDGAGPKIVGPKVKVTNPVLASVPVGPAPGPIPVTVNIPLKYYGFVKPSPTTSINSGLFLDGDNVLVATEGQTVAVQNSPKRYLVVELTPNSARLEDTQLKQGQTLPVVPVAAQ